MNKEMHSAEANNQPTGKKMYTGKDLIEATKEILKADNIGSKLPDNVVEKLSKLLAKTALKGDL